MDSIVGIFGIEEKTGLFCGIDDQVKVTRCIEILNIGGKLHCYKLCGKRRQHANIPETPIWHLKRFHSNYSLLSPPTYLCK